MKKYLIDTNIFIESFKKNKKALTFLKDNSEVITLPYIVAGELLQGARNKQELSKITRLTDSFYIHFGNQNITKNALKIIKKHHLKHNIGLLDALIAAMAKDMKVILVTQNTKHFRFIKDLEILNPL